MARSEIALSVDFWFNLVAICQKKYEDLMYDVVFVLIVLEHLILNNDREQRTEDFEVNVTESWLYVILSSGPGRVVNP